MCFFFNIIGYPQIYYLGTTLYFHIYKGNVGTQELMKLHHARIQKILSEGVQLLQRSFSVFFLVDEGKEDPNTTISGSPSARQRNAIEMAFR